ncbi:glycosyltransferase family 4 protein [Photobacterium kagoshimensis]|uniref:glycosyltransferase family 4 protein n=1 Tax=Photobacterium kagoshimensis TaxID=2910242 RepID=UPI003D0CEC99
MKKKKVLVIAEYIGENHNSTAYYWSQIVKHLHETFDVILITPDTEHSRGFSEKYCVPTQYIQFVQHNKNKLITRLLGQIKQTNIFYCSIRQHIDEVDLVFSGTNPIVTMFAMALMKLKKNFKWLVLVHDIFPNNLVPAKVLRSSSLLYRLLTYFSKKVYSAPDHLICIGRDMKTLLKGKVGQDTKITFVPNWASTSVITPQLKAENELISSLDWQDNIVFQFFGNMGRLQGVPNLLKAIELTGHKNARFLFIGCGSESNAVEQLAKTVNESLDYERVNYYGRLDLEKNNTGLNACDVALVTLSSDMVGLGVPSKAYFSMAANKPIVYVGDKGSELELLLSDYKLGWHCTSDNPDALAELLDRITEDLSKSSFKHDFTPRKVLEESFSEQMALSEILKVAEDVIES